MKTQKILVCGTKWAQSYLIPILADRPKFSLEASQLSSVTGEMLGTYQSLCTHGRKILNLGTSVPKFELAGILSQGSARSNALCEKLGVPLWRSVDEINQPIDLACVAVGNDPGRTMALQLLEKGIHVLQEHSITSEHYQKAAHLAQRHGVNYEVNYHFDDCTPGLEFIQRAHELNKNRYPEWIQVTCHLRTIYSAFAILAGALGEVTRCEVEKLPSGSTRTPFQSLSGEVNGIPFILNCQTAISSKDDGSGVLLPHGISFVYSAGVLTLQDAMQGPMTWFENHLSHSKKTNSGAFDIDSTFYFEEMLRRPGDNSTQKWKVDGEKQLYRASDLVAVRASANRLAMERTLLSKTRTRQHHEGILKSLDLFAEKLGTIAMHT